MAIKFSDLARALAISLLITTVFVLPSPAFAQNQWSGVCVGPAEIGAEDVATIRGFQCLVANVFSVILTVIGLAGFVMFIIGSFRWMLSGSNSKGVEQARGAMTYAIIGIVVALSGFIILNLIAAFTGLEVITQFRIPVTDVPGS